MSDEIKSGAYIAFELVVYTLILGVIAFLGSSAYSMSNEHDYRQNVSANLREHKELSLYNNNYVGGDSLVLATKRYTQNFGICVVVDKFKEPAGIKPIYEPVFRLDMNDSLDDWSEDNVRKLLKTPDNGYIFSTFYSFFNSGGVVREADLTYAYPSCTTGDLVFQLTGV